jgi:arylformamidase
MQIIDLSMPIGPHFRWQPEIQVKGDIGAGDQFRITRLATTCHGFTHVDAQAHFFAGGPTIEATPLSRVVGPARVLDLRAVAPNTAIGAAALAARDPGGREGEILILSAAWDLKRDSATPGFWKDAPWLTRDAATWLEARKPRRSRSTSRRTIRSACCSMANRRRPRSMSRTTCCCAPASR